MSSSSFEKILEKEGQLIYSNVGDSMLPLIRQGRDLLVIRRQTGRLKKYDVPLYRRDSGQYVLHRVLKVRDNDYVICGDNRWHRETGITDRHILGVLTAIIRDGKEVPVTEKMEYFCPDPGSGHARGFRSAVCASPAGDCRRCHRA